MLNGIVRMTARALVDVMDYAWVATWRALPTIFAIRAELARFASAGDAEPRRHAQMRIVLVGSDRGERAGAFGQAVH